MARITHEINKDNLKSELDKRGLSLAEASAEIGYSEAYLSYVLSTGKISDSAMKLLESAYNIKREAYVILNESKPAPAFDANELYKIIYGAVYEAVKKAWSE